MNKRYNGLLNIIIIDVVIFLVLIIILMPVDYKFNVISCFDLPNDNIFGEHLFSFISFKCHIFGLCD